MIKFILKGILRDRSRSLFPILVVFFGVFLTVAFYCYMGGAITNFTDTATRFDSGHVKIMSRAYDENSDQVPNDLAFIGVRGLIGELKQDFPNYVWTPRIRFRRTVGCSRRKRRNAFSGPCGRAGHRSFLRKQFGMEALGHRGFHCPREGTRKTGRHIDQRRFRRESGDFHWRESHADRLDHVRKYGCRQFYRVRDCPFRYIRPLTAGLWWLM